MFRRRQRDVIGHTHDSRFRLRTANWPKKVATGSGMTVAYAADGFVADPLSRDLLVSICNHGQTAIYAVMNPEESSPAITPSATAPSPECMDGLAHYQRRSASPRCRYGIWNGRRSHPRI